MLRRFLVVAALSALGLLASVPLASATFHLISIREVFPGSSAKPGAEYVELQMWAAGQELVAGHPIRTYDATGTPTGTDSFPADVARGADQSTLVLATPEAEAEFGFTADAAISPSRLDPAGGAVCWETIDCVAWGNFSGPLPSPAGTPAGAIPDGMALRRTIAPGCPTLLEALDDRDNSAVDFAPAFPGPRPNSVVPSERACGSAGAGGAGGGGGQGSPGRGAPGTKLRGRPAKRSRDRTPTFRFVADQGDAGFECRLDARPFRPCRSPFTARGLSPGRHIFRVRARGNSGQADPAPASFSFRILPRG